MTKALTMKKIITLLIMSGAFATCFAQSTTIDKAKEVITKEPRNTTGTYPNDKRVGDDNASRYPTSASREAEINDINRYYNSKIEAVRRNPLLSSEEKERRIRELEYERAQKVREINMRYGNNPYSKNKSNGKNKGYDKKDNPGKHLGWEKGKGNPHSADGTAKGKDKNK